MGSATGFIKYNRYIHTCASVCKGRKHFTGSIDSCTRQRLDTFWTSHNSMPIHGNAFKLSQIFVTFSHPPIQRCPSSFVFSVARFGLDQQQPDHILVATKCNAVHRSWSMAAPLLNRSPTTSLRTLRAAIYNAISPLLPTTICRTVSGRPFFGCGAICKGSINNAKTSDVWGRSRVKVRTCWGLCCPTDDSFSH